MSAKGKSRTKRKKSAEDEDSDFSGLESADEGEHDVPMTSDVMQSLHQEARGRVAAVTARLKQIQTHQEVRQPPQYDVEGEQILTSRKLKKDGTPFTQEELRQRKQKMKEEAKVRQEKLKLKEERKMADEKRRIEKLEKKEKKAQEKEERRKEREEKETAKKVAKQVAEEKKEQRRQKYAPQKKEALTFPDRSVIYLSHLPYGFFEDQIKTFFTQFGTITRIRYARNEYGKSQHWAFVEFEDKEVAPIVAEAFNDYIMFGRVIKCSVVPQEDVHHTMFSETPIRYKSKQISRRIAIETHNQPKTKHSQTKRTQRLIKKEKELRNKLKGIGVDYSFSGYIGKRPAKGKRVKIPEDEQ